MDNLSIPATKYTPEIYFDAQKNTMYIKGDSYPENTFAFYKPILSWLEHYFNQSKVTAIFHFELVYYNSSTSKVLYDLFDFFEAMQNKNHTINIHWHYHPENSFSLESGEEFQEDFAMLNIQLVATKDDE